MAAPPGLRGRSAHDPEDRIAALVQSEFGAGAAPEPQSEFGADLDRVAYRALAAAAPLGAAVLRQQEPIQDQPLATYRRQPPDRRAAGAVEGRKHRALRRDAGRAHRVVQRREQP